jgi:hypothetical protein
VARCETDGVTSRLTAFGGEMLLADEGLEVPLG